MNTRTKKLFSTCSLILLLAFGSYTYLWFHAAEQLESLLLHNINILEKEGYLPSYDRIEVKGYPLKLEVRFTNPALQLPKLLPIKVSCAGLLIASASVWEPTRATLKTDHKLSFLFLGTESEEQDLASIENISLELPLVVTPSPTFVFELKGLTLRDWNVDHLQGKLLLDLLEQKNNITITLKNLGFNTQKMKLSLPSPIQNIAFDATFIMPRRFEQSLKHLLQSWHEQEGMIDLNKFDITWSNIRIEGNGSLALDQELQPLAAFSAEIYGMDQFLTALVQEKIVHKNLAPIIKIALKPFAASKGTDKREIYHKIAFSIQDRQLSIASIPVMKFDMINWNEVEY